MSKLKINLNNLRDWQKEYIKNKKRFNVLVVHRRAGKTVGEVLDLLIEMVKDPYDYGYIAPTYRQAKKIAWRMIQKFGNQIEGFKYNSSELVVTYENGSTLSLFGAESPDSLRGLDLKGVVFDEYAQQPSWIYGEIIFPMINANNGWVVWIGTPKGKNAFYKLFERAKKDDRFYTVLLKHSDTKLLNEQQIEDARREMTEEEFEQEYNCSFEAFMKGAVYGKELQIANKEGRITTGLYNPDVLVDTFWDLGISDAMTVLFVQVVGREIRIIDSYKNSGYGLDHYSSIVNNKTYKYNKHYFPHDIQHREISTGMSRLDTAVKLLGSNCDVVPMNSIESGINAGRLIFKHIYINEELEEFTNDLSLYQYEYDEKRGEFTKTPKHDWTSHYADAFRYLATIYEFIIKTPIKQEEQDDLIVNPYNTTKKITTLDFDIFGDDEEEMSSEIVQESIY